MDDGSIYMVIGLICLVALSAFFSSAETAYSCVNRIRLKRKAEEGDVKAARVMALADEYDKLLSTILIGNNIVNIAATSIATVLFTRWVGAGKAPTVSTIVMTVVVLIFGEVTPKSLAKHMPERFTLLTAPILKVLVTIFTPANFLFGVWKTLIKKMVGVKEEEGITEGDLITMVDEAETSGGLTDRESELIKSAIEFDDVETEEVLTPRVDVVALADDATMEEAAETFAESGFSRLPVYHDTIDNIIGVVHEKDFYIARKQGEKRISDIAKPTLYTTGGTPISALLRTLREQHHHMAVVVDEYGGTEGIITLEDILEELVGEIWDEHDEVVEDFRQQSDGSWLCSGSANVDDLYETLGIREDDSIDAVSISGLVQDQLHRLPKVQDQFTLPGYEGIVTRTAKRRVVEVRLKAVKSDAEKAAGETSKNKTARES
ncbi:MAG: hemolysin family protein [Lachnospiraceae bacterium]|nr:hemolysin family protein [Lachnospiraceae bacterium]